MNRLLQAALVLLASCSGASATDALSAVCEQAIQQALDAPSTYQRVSLAPSVSTANADEVAIQFDAENVYGTPIRYRVLCSNQAGAEPQLWTIKINGDIYLKWKREFTELNAPE